MRIEEAPGPGRSARVLERKEMLGGKGANQAVSIAQLGGRPALVGVVGDDQVGAWLLDAARADGVDVAAVARRAGVTSGMVVDVVDASGAWRYLEDLPPAVALEPADVEKATAVIQASGSVVIQLQQPPEAVMAAIGAARSSGVTVVLDGSPPRRWRDRILAGADVVRADDAETELMLGEPVRGGSDALAAGRRLLAMGPSLAVLGAGREGNAVVWEEGDEIVPLSPAEVVDTTGAGDALVATMVLALARGFPPGEAVRRASAAAGSVVGRLGGRPALDPRLLD